ncbi:NAD(P)H-dependent FMN reductase [Rhizobium leguminosarum]|nr:NAD(P)H-dependent FMN reductase [Rhizobium leguminosarum]
MSISSSAKPRIALIIGSTRAARFADVPAQWMLKQAQARTDLDVELVDLRDFNLPFFDEVASSGSSVRQCSDSLRIEICMMSAGKTTV